MTTLPRRREFTRADLDAWPDDGWRHELVDGSLVMTPGPSWIHQRVAFRLATILERARPAHLEVLTAPFDVTLAEDTVVQPDVLVVRRGDYAAAGLFATPRLAVEVLSPSTRHIDLGLKLRRYETARCPSYWVVDPGGRDALPSLTAWQLEGDAYVVAARASVDEVARLELPFPVEIVPARLLE